MASRRGALYGLGGAGQRESEAGLLGGRRRFWRPLGEGLAGVREPLFGVAARQAVAARERLRRLLLGQLR
jgi:hypothetical protein